jgi:hypothetical protein
MLNELAERNTREEENGEISPRALHVKRKDLTSLFGRIDTMNELNSGVKRRNHGLSVVIPNEGTGEALRERSMGRKVRSDEDVKRWVNPLHKETQVPTRN